VAVEPMQRALDESPPGNTGRAPTRPSPSAAVTQRFAPVINLPQNSEIVAVNGHAVTSEDGAVKEVMKGLTGGVPVTMNLKTPAGIERVYLMPQAPESAPKSR
jgi:hypothetical protein